MPDLETRTMGLTGMRPKALGLGRAYFGTKDFTDDEAVEGIRHAIEIGLNFVDMSPLYGQSERRVGLALAGGLREKVYLQTKVGTHPEKRHDFSAEAIRWSVENRLRLLKTDRFDSVLLHDPRDIEDALAPGRALDELLKMKEEGLLDHIGIGYAPTNSIAVQWKRDTSKSPSLSWITTSSPSPPRTRSSRWPASTTWR